MILVFCCLCLLSLLVHGIFETAFVDIAVDDKSCHGGSLSARTDAPDYADGPNSCAVGMGIAAAVFSVVTWIPLAFESYTHQGRSVSINGVGYSSPESETIEDRDGSLVG